MGKRFLVVMEPKRGWREGCAIQFVVVIADSKTEAIRLASECGMGGESMYFKKPTAELFGENHVFKA